MQDQGERVELVVLEELDMKMVEEEGEEEEEEEVVEAVTAGRRRVLNKTSFSCSSAGRAEGGDA